MTRALLQDWLDLEGVGNSEVLQSGSRWPNLDGYQDVTFWLEVRLQTPGTELRMSYQTAPVGEPALFTNMTGDILMTTATGTVPIITPVRQAGNPLVPLSGLVRWRISAISGGAWKTSFRIHYVAKRR